MRIYLLGDQLGHIAKLYDPDDMTTKGISTPEGTRKTHTLGNTHTEGIAQDVVATERRTHLEIFGQYLHYIHYAHYSII